MHGRSLFEMNVLREQPELQATRAYHFALIGRLFAVYEPEDCRLARAIPTHKSDVLARINLEASAAQNVLRAV